MPHTPRVAVLYCNLGTPDTPGTPDVKRFLAEFLNDPRVVDMARLPWLMLLHGYILRKRPALSAAKYASIWTKEGSPLKVWTEKQAKMLQGWLAERGHDILVRYAMRYGSVSMASQLDALMTLGVTHILVLPAYPQYSATTTASLWDAIHQWSQTTRNIPELRFVKHYHDDPRYISALAGHVRHEWKGRERPNVVVMSFHGLPARSTERGDPYHSECLQTGQLLAQALKLTPTQYKITFQSRLGRAKWLEPDTQATLIELGKAGTQRVDVLCPSFTCDCLETLQEINEEAQTAFLGAGGKEFHYIACLNNDHAWITALADMTLQHLQGWPTTLRTDDANFADAPPKSRNSA